MPWSAIGAGCQATNSGNREENHMQPLYVVISGCSGGGKSTLLAELARRGFGVVEEPGRRIIREEGLRPEAGMEVFLHRCFALACADFERVQATGRSEPGPVPGPVSRPVSRAARRQGAEPLPGKLQGRVPVPGEMSCLTPAPGAEPRPRPDPATGAVFFDRSALDALVGLARLGLAPARGAPTYHPNVFLAPPWREIYRQDAERRHDFDAGVAEYHALVDGLPEYGYEVGVIPKLPVEARADYVLAALGLR
jgi:predicted ATPase